MHAFLFAQRIDKPGKYMDDEEIMKVLDLGCGQGKRLDHVGISCADEVIGADLIPLSTAQHRYPERRFVQARGEALPFRDSTFDAVVCLLALPYMDIPLALSEVRRVLRPGGSFRMTVHGFQFTCEELRQAFPRPTAMSFRLFVMFNGLWFHLTGKLLRWGNRPESFQTTHALTKSLQAAGFSVASIVRPEDRKARIVVFAKAA